jgi:hypothetical protein
MGILCSRDDSNNNTHYDNLHHNNVQCDCKHKLGCYYYNKTAKDKNKTASALNISPAFSVSSDSPISTSSYSSDQSNTTNTASKQYKPSEQNQNVVFKSNSWNGWNNRFGSM